MTAVSSHMDAGRLPGVEIIGPWEEGVEAAAGSDGGGSLPFGRNGSYGSSYDTEANRRRGGGGR